MVLAECIDVLDEVFFDDLGAERRRRPQSTRVVAACVDVASMSRRWCAVERPHRRRRGDVGS